MTGQTDIAPGWEVVARKTQGAWTHLFLQALQMLLMQPPVTHSSVTFTVRSRDTGEVRKVTAKTLDDAALRIAHRQFDKE